MNLTESSGVVESLCSSTQQHRFWSGVIWDVAKAGCKWDGQSPGK